MAHVIEAPESSVVDRAAGKVDSARTTLLTLVGLMALGATLRFARLGHQSLGHDEAVTVGQILQPSLGATFHALLNSGEHTPYLYYGLASLWTHVAGTGAAGVRSLSAVFGVATIPATFAAARAAVSERAGLFAAALVTVDPFLVYYSQEARSYALFALLAACSLWAFACALEDSSTRALAGWAIASALMLYAHYFAILPVAVEAAWLIALTRPRRRALIAVAVPVAAGLALLPLLLHQKSGASISETTLARQLPTVLVQFTLGQSLSIRGAYTATPLLGSLVLIAAVLLSWLAWRRRLRPLFAIATVGLLTLLTALATGVFGAHIFSARYCIGALIALLMLLAGILSLTRPQRLGVWVTAILCVCGLAMSAALAVVPALQRPDYRDADALLGGVPHGPRALVISPGGDVPTLYYRAAERPESWPSTATNIDEIAVLAAGDAPPALPPPRGFRAFEVHDTGTVRVTVLRAATLRALSRAELSRLAPPAHVGTVLLEAG